MVYDNLVEDFGGTIMTNSFKFEDGSGGAAGLMVVRFGAWSKIRPPRHSFGMETLFLFRISLRLFSSKTPDL